MDPPGSDGLLTLQIWRRVPSSREREIGNIFCFSWLIYYNFWIIG